MIVLDEDVGLSKKTDSATVTLFPANILVRYVGVLELCVRVCMRVSVTVCVGVCACVYRTHK